MEEYNFVFVLEVYLYLFGKSIWICINGDERFVHNLSDASVGRGDECISQISAKHFAQITVGLGMVATGKPFTI